MDERGGHSSAIHQALEIVARRKWTGLAIFLCVFVPALSVAKALPYVYRASATVLVERQQVPDAFVRPTVTDEFEVRLHAISEEVMSRSRLLDLIRKLDLYPKERATLSPEGLADRMRRDIALDLKGVERTWDRGATVAFALGYRGRDPDKVAEVANALAALYVSQNEESREQQATRTAEFLKSQLDDVKKKLEAQEDRIGQYKRRHPGELPQDVEPNMTVLSRLNAQLETNAEKQARAQERRDRLEDSLPDGASGAAGGSPDETEARIRKLTLQLAELRRQYTDNYPDVVRLRREIDGLKKQAAEAPHEPAPAGTPAASAGRPAEKRPAESELVALKREESRLRASIAEYERRIDAAPQRQQDFQALTRDYQTTKDLYDSLLKHYQESLVAQSMEHGQATEQFRVLDPAVPPRLPAAPNRPWLALMGLLLSLGAAAAGMALAEQLDTSFHGVDGLRAFTRLPVLARIPRIVTRGDRVRGFLKASLAVVCLSAVLAGVAAVSYRVARGQEQLVFILGGGRQ